MKLQLLISCILLCACSVNAQCPQTQADCASDDTYVRHWITVPLYRPLQDVLNSLTADQMAELESHLQKTQLLPSQKFTIRYNLGKAFTHQSEIGIYQKMSDPTLIQVSQVITATLTPPFTGTTMEEYEDYWKTHWTALNTANGCDTCSTTDFSDMELAYSDPENYELHKSSSTWKLKYNGPLGNENRQILTGVVTADDKLLVNRDPDGHEVDRNTEDGIQPISLEFPVSLQYMPEGYQQTFGVGLHTGYMFASAITDENDMLELSYGQLDRCVCVRHEDVKGLQEQVVASGKVDGNCNVI